jgi:hypothetical protein
MVAALPSTGNLAWSVSGTAPPGGSSPFRRSGTSLTGEPRSGPPWHCPSGGGGPHSSPAGIETTHDVVLRGSSARAARPLSSMELSLCKPRRECRPPIHHRCAGDSCTGRCGLSMFLKPGRECRPPIRFAQRSRDTPASCVSVAHPSMGLPCCDLTPSCDRDLIFVAKLVQIISSAVYNPNFLSLRSTNLNVDTLRPLPIAFGALSPE